MFAKRTPIAVGGPAAPMQSYGNAEQSRCGTMDRVSQPSQETPNGGEFVVLYDPMPAQQRVQRWRRMVRSRLISLVLSVVLMGILFVWQRQQLMTHPVPTFIVYALVLLSAVGWLVGTLIAYRLARRAAAGVGEGVAIHIDRVGLEFAGRRLAWGQVGGLATVKGRWPSGPLLQLTRSDGAAVAVPLEQLAVLPASLDGAVRAFSGGRFGVDLTALDS